VGENQISLKKLGPNRAELAFWIAEHSLFQRDTIGQNLQSLFQIDFAQANTGSGFDE
jgi:hypothetical protein